ncbi:sepiapterin reductase [Drosophila novamexicana]|uniref:sepiapterin reductase n=1 Tax=Drosophila novamexicana TaxID=47314 RepID=UPI0011E5EE6D|nr:sepiapterin reductase [Drosophila novamexicana]
MNLEQRTYLLVTGASRGIGRELAEQLARQLLPTGSVVVLLGRSEPLLQETKASILADRPKLDVHSCSLELATASAKDFGRIFDKTLPVNGCNEFERAIVVHNAGTLGDTSQHARELADTKILEQYYHINLFSALALNSEFMRVFAGIPKLVVNLSTLAALEPFSSMAYYCTVKAAREMYFRVLALEEPSTETLVLNYAPGVIDTQMTLQVQRESHDPALAAAFKEQRESKTMLTPQQTVSKFLQVLRAQKFKSGDHVDYRD